MAFKSFSKTVTTPGTAEPLSDVPLSVLSWSLMPLGTNAGSIYAGDSTVDSTSPALAAYQTIGWDGDANFGTRGRQDLANVYIDASVAGEGVGIWYVDAA